MKILLLTTHLRMGGVPIYVVTLAAALKKLGHQVFVASSGGDLVKRLTANSIPHFKVDIDTSSELNPKILPAAYHLFWFIKENSIEIIHTHTRLTQVLAKILSLITGVTHVSTCHGFFKPRIGRRLFGCWGRKIIAISDAVREDLVHTFHIEKSRIALINNGIDTEAFSKTYSKNEKDAIRRAFGLKDGPVVGIIARLSAVKGHRYLLKAMKAVLQRFKNAQLFVVGEGEEEKNLRDLARQLGIEKSVNFTKSVLDTGMVLAVIDVFVLPSVEEGLGLAAIEALAAGKAVVASDVGGIYSVVKDNVTGLLVPAKEPENLAEAILRMLEDKELAVRLAANGQRYVRQNFALGDMVKKVEAVYKEALG
jgi:glycosyltransferase involved in cell wall biosynthesis